MKQPLSAIFSLSALVSWLVLAPSVLAAEGDVFGNVTLPEPLQQGYGGVFATGGGTGIIGFVSNLIKLIIILGGVLALINIVLAGITYITTQGNPEKIMQANQQIYMSLVGLAIMVGSFALAALAGWLLFGDASAILAPQIYGPGIVGVGGTQ
jgi:hypothetical protein